MKILQVKTTFKVHITPCKVIRIPESEKFCLWNPESSENLFVGNWESGIQLKKSGIPLTIKIRNPSSTNKESEIYCPESGIHSVESRIQDCLAFPYIMWHTNHNELYWQQRANNKIDHGKFTVPNTCTRILQVKTRHLRYTNELLCRQQRTNRVFSLTWPASMQIYRNKRKRLHKKRVQLPEDWFGTPTWPPFHCFETPIWPPWRHVKTLHSLFVGISDEIEIETVAILTKRRS